MDVLNDYALFNPMDKFLAHLIFSRGCVIKINQVCY